MKPKIELAKSVMKRALISYEVSEKRANEIVFHLTDWIDDLIPFVNFLEDPASHSDEAVEELIIKFLAHAPDHLKCAAEIALE